MKEEQSVSFLKPRNHCVFWAVFYLYNYISNSVLDPRFVLTVGNLLNYLLFFLSVLVFNFYTTVYYLNLIKYKKASFFQGAALLVLFLALSLGLAIFNRKYMQPLLINNASPINYYKYITFWSFQFIYYFAFGAAYFFVREFMREKINSSNLEKEKIIVEVNLLRSQINPHFLFNTLNVLYAKAFIYSEDLADKIQKLSEIMRFAYLPKWGEGGHVPVSEEIIHIKNLIAIHEFRLSNKDIFDFKIQGDLYDIFLPPLLLVTLVENMFKHGHLASDSPASVLVKFEANTFTFIGENKIKTAVSLEEKSGVGLANIISRLNKYYKGKYTFNFNEKNGYFHTTLIINLN